MRIQSSDLIAGQPAPTIRKLMRMGREYGPGTSGISPEYVAEILAADLPTTLLVLKDLCRLGYVEPVSPPAPKEEDQFWYTTVKGNALANATARKPISRKTADRLIQEFLIRVQHINAGDYAYRVKRVIVFGSYLSDAPTMNDVDLSLDLEDRYQDVEARKKGHEARIAAAEEAGRHFKDYVQVLVWPQQEVYLYLKHHSPSLSFHEEEREQVLAQHHPSKIIFDADVSTHEERASNQ